MGRRKAGAKRDRGARTTGRPAGRPAKRGRAEKKRGGRRERKNLATRLSRVSPRVVILAILAVVFIAFAFGPTMRNLEATSRLKKKEAEFLSLIHISEPTRLGMISYAVFCLKKKKQ